MPRRMLTNEYRSKLKPIQLDLAIYDKSHLRNTLKFMLFRIRVGCLWRGILESFGSANTIYYC